MKNYKKQVMCVLSLLLLMPGCGGGSSKKNSNILKNDDKKSKKEVRKKEMRKEVDIPVSSDAIRNFFDEDEEVQDFLLDSAELAQNDALQQENKTDMAEEFSWVNDNEQESALKVVHYEFDKASIKEDQKSAIDFNAEVLKQKIADAQGSHQVKVIAEGHSCHSAGSHAHNMVLAEHRARAMRDALVERGVPAENIKVVSRGDEAPAIVNGKKVTGDRQSQWKNRRCEIHVLQA